MFRRSECLYPSKGKCENVHGGFFHNSLKLETQMSIKNNGQKWEKKKINDECKLLQLQKQQQG